MKLINVITNNNIDKINNQEVNNIEEYRELLKSNIRNRIEYIINNKTYCLDNIMKYLEFNKIDLDNNFDNENQINTLHRIKYLLNNIPSCEELKKYENINNKLNIKNSKIQIFILQV